MIRRITAVALALALAGLISAPASAKAAKAQPKPTSLVYYLNWSGDCAGAGFLASPGGGTTNFAHPCFLYGE